MSNSAELTNRKRFTPTKGVYPFTTDELDRMQVEARQGGQRSSLSNAELVFLLARWTGLRSVDLAALRWEHVLFDRKEIVHVCQKNCKQVILPISWDLLVALQTEFRERNPQPSEPVMLNPITGEPFTSRALWEFIVRLGRRAGVEHANPYRFRVTFAVLCRPVIGDSVPGRNEAVPGVREKMPISKADKSQESRGRNFYV